MVFTPNVGVIIRKNIGPGPGFWINSLPNTPPIVNITNPVDGAVFTIPASIVLGANASEAAGWTTPEVPIEKKTSHDRAAITAASS